MSESKFPFNLDDSDKPKRRGDFANLNTILLGIVLALSGWTLNRVSTLSEMMAVAISTAQVQQRDMEAMKARLISIETRQQELALEIVGLQRQSRP